MIDQRSVERAAERFTAPERAFERLIRRRDRRRRKQRLAAGTVGMAIFVAALWITTSLGALDPGIQEPGGETVGPRAKTRVTIVKDQRLGYVYLGGTVQSNRPFKCAKDRSVVLFKQRGPEQDPTTDRRVSTDTASLLDRRYRWRSDKIYNSGRYYALVPRTEFCRADTSRTVYVGILG